jgi:predicted amidophosphoribosyltransferase
LYGSFLYETPVGTSIKSLKFDDERALGTILGGMFNTEAMDRSEADVIVLVPMHSSRLRSWGFNQSGLFARMLSNRMEVAFGGDVLVRVGQTIPQSEQPTAAARHGALLGAFEVRASRVSAVVGKRILKVDDVFTTGSTVKGCAAALKTHGASWVGVAASAVQPIGALK